MHLVQVKFDFIALSAFDDFILLLLGIFFFSRDEESQTQNVKRSLMAQIQNFLGQKYRHMQTIAYCVLNLNFLLCVFRLRLYLF